MVGGEGGNLGNESEAPGRICKSVTLYSLCRPENVASAGVIFFQRVTPGLGTLFVPLEVAFRDNFLPSLLGGRIDKVTYSLDKYITWGVKRAGIGITDPTQTAPANFETSEHCFEVLTA